MPRTTGGVVPTANLTFILGPGRISLDKVRVLVKFNVAPVSTRALIRRPFTLTGIRGILRSFLTWCIWGCWAPLEVLFGIPLPVGTVVSAEWKDFTPAGPRNSRRPSRVGPGGRCRPSQARWGGFITNFSEFTMSVVAGPRRRISFRTVHCVRSGFADTGFKGGGTLFADGVFGSNTFGVGTIAFGVGTVVFGIGTVVFGVGTLFSDGDATKIILQGGACIFGSERSDGIRYGDDIGSGALELGCAGAVRSLLGWSRRPRRRFLGRLVDRDAYHVGALA